MRVLGVDPALTVTGIGVIDVAGRSARLVKAGVIITASEQPMPQRLEMLHREVCAVIRSCRPAVVVLEKVFVHAQHPTTAYVLGQARGMVSLAAQQNGLQVEELAATQVKKAIVGRGQASKEQIMRMVCSVLGMNQLPRYHDVSDALALALAYKDQTYDFTHSR